MMDGSVTIGDVYDYACTALATSVTTTPTRREKLLVENLLKSQESSPRKTAQHAVKALVYSANRWKDVDVLFRTLKVFRIDKKTSLLGVEDIVSCCYQFGWSTMEALCVFCGSTRFAI
jgi:hypothetical protein